MDVISIAAAAKKAKNYTDSIALNGVSVNYPKVVDGKWQVYDSAANAYINTGVEAQGEQGIQGIQGDKGDDGKIQSIIAGLNVIVDSTDPSNPVISASGGGDGEGGVSSYNDLTDRPKINGVTLEGDLPLVKPSELEAETTARQAEYETLTEAVKDQETQITALRGGLVYIGAVGDLTVDITREMLNDYAASKGHVNLTGGETIIDGGDGYANPHDWRYDADSELWIDLGMSNVSVATNDSQGIVKGSDRAAKVSVDALGEMTLNGYTDVIAGINSQIEGLTGNVRAPLNLRFTAERGIDGTVDFAVESSGYVTQYGQTNDTGEVDISLSTDKTYNFVAKKFNGSFTPILPAVKTIKSGLLNLRMNETFDLIDGGLSDVDYFDRIRETATQNESVSFRTTSLFGSLAGSYMWGGGVLAHNGKIYGIPELSTSVLEIDPISKTTALFGNLPGASAWDSGVFAPNGKIYGVPAMSASVLEIDPINRTTSLFGSLAGTSYKYLGGVLAANGKIYCVPYDSTSVLEIDPVGRTTSLFGSLAGTAKWRGGVLAPNGKIYCVPYDSASVLEIDPVNRATSLFGSLAGTAKWQGGALAANGKIYCVPYDSTSVLEIDPVNRATSLFGSLAGTAKWASGTTAANGKIYCVPYDSTSVLEIDPVGRTTSLFGNFAGAAKYLNSVLALNGKMYCIPYNSAAVLEISTEDDFVNFGSTSLCSGFLNKF